MLNNTIRLFIILLSFSLSSCESLETSSKNTASKPNEASAIMYDVNKVAIFGLYGKEKVLQVENIISQKQIMLKKLLPIFEMTLVIKNGNGKQQWQFARPNYLKELKSGKIFVSKDNLDIYVFLEQLSK